MPDNRQGGFTLPEVLVVVTITVALGAAIAAFALGGMGLITEIQGNEIKERASQRAVAAFREGMRDAERVVSADASAVTFDYQRGDRCQRHTYAFETDPDTAGAKRLRHQIVERQLPDPALSCGDLNATLAAALPNVDRVEVSGLRSPEFIYANMVGQVQALPLPVRSCPASETSQGRPNYVEVSTVTIRMPRTAAASGISNTLEYVDSTSATNRAAALGMACA